MFVCVQEGVHACVYTHMEANLQGRSSGLIHTVSVLVFFRWGLFLALCWRMRQAGQQVSPRNLPVLASPTLELQVHATTPSFFIWALYGRWESNSSLHAYTAKHFTT